MKYYIIDDCEEVKTVEYSLKERIDTEEYHNFLYISDAEIQGYVCHPILSNVELKEGNQYNVVIVRYSENDLSNPVNNKIAVIGIYDDVVTANKVVSTLKRDMKKGMENNLDWMKEDSTLEEVISIKLSFKHGEKDED